MYSSARGLPGQSQAGLQLRPLHTLSVSERADWALGALGWQAGCRLRIRQKDKQTDRHARRTEDRPDTQDAHWVRTEWRVVISAAWDLRQVRRDWLAEAHWVSSDARRFRTDMGRSQKRADERRAGRAWTQGPGLLSQDRWTQGLKACSCGRAGLEKTRNPAK